MTPPSGSPPRMPWSREGFSWNCVYTKLLKTFAFLQGCGALRRSVSNLRPGGAARDRLVVWSFAAGFKAGETCASEKERVPLVGRGG